MKRIIAGLVAVSIAFGGLALPAAESGFDVSIAASAEEMSGEYATNEESAYFDEAAPSEEPYIAEQAQDDVQVAESSLTYGDYEYDVLTDGTVEISRYKGTNKDVVIPSKINGKKVTRIGYAAFGEEVGVGGSPAATTVESVVIPQGVTRIERSAFFYCEFLKKVTIPKSVTYFGRDAFTGTPWLEAQQKKDPLVIVNNILIDASTAEGEVTIPDGVTSIASAAFYDNYLITKINFADSVTRIEDEAIWMCDNITHMFLPKNLTYFGGTKSCENLVTIVIPKSVTGIGLYAFNECNYLKKIYYTGTKEEWKKLSEDNAYLNISSDIVRYNYDYSEPILDVCSKYFNFGLDGVRIKWIPAPDADGYKAYFYNSSNKKWELKGTVRDGKAENIEIYGLKAGTKYKFRVRAYAKRNGKTYWGDYVTGTVMTKLATPKVTSTSSTKNSVTLKWGKVKSADGYRVYRYDSKTKKWKTLATVKNGKTSYVDKKSLKSKTTYKYKVKAYHKWMYGGTFWSYSSAAKSVKTK